MLLIPRFRRFLSGFGRNPTAINLLTNSGFETNTTGWDGTQAAVSRVTTEHRGGIAAMKVLYTAGGTFYRCFSPTSALVGGSAGQQHTYSAWVKGSGDSIGLRVYVYVNAFGGAVDETVKGSAVVLTANWQKVEKTYTLVANDLTTLQMFVQRETDEPVAAEFFYVDDAQMQTGAVSTEHVLADGAAATGRANRVI